MQGEAGMVSGERGATTPAARESKATALVLRKKPSAAIKYFAPGSEPFAQMARGRPGCASARRPGRATAGVTADRVRDGFGADSPVR